jgi:hypothetical protein
VSEVHDANRARTAASVAMHRRGPFRTLRNRLGHALGGRPTTVAGPPGNSWAVAGVSRAPLRAPTPLTALGASDRANRFVDPVLGAYGADGLSMARLMIRNRVASLLAFQSAAGV